MATTYRNILQNVSPVSLETSGKDIPVASSATVQPGMLLVLSGAIDAEYCAPHATAGGQAPGCRIALERSMVGRSVTDTYVQTGSVYPLVPTCVLRPGERAAMLLATGNNVSFDDPLESNGDGSLRKQATDTSWSTVKIQSVVARAREALNNASGSPVLILVERV